MVINEVWASVSVCVGRELLPRLCVNAVAVKITLRVGREEEGEEGGRREEKGGHVAYWTPAGRG